MSDEKIKKINELSYKYSDYISLWVYDSEDGIFISGKSDVILNGFEASRGQEAMKNTRFKIKETGLESIYNEPPKINGLDKKLYVYKNDNITQAVATRDLEIEDDSGEISIDSIEVTDVDGKIVKPENSESNSKSKFKFKLKSEDSNEEKYIKTDGIREFKLNYKVTDAWGRSATYQRTVSVISRSVSNDIEFYNKAGNENLFSLKYNPITNTFDVSKKENTPPSQEEQQPSESEGPAEQEPSQGIGASSDKQLQTKTGDSQDGNIEQVPPSNSDEQEGSSEESHPEEGGNNQEQIPPSEDNGAQDEEQPGGAGESNNQQAKAEIVFKLTVFNTNEEKVGEIQLKEEETNNIEKIKEGLEKITIYDDYYVALWSNTPQRIRIKGKVKDNDKLGEEENKEINYSQGTEEKDYIDNVRFRFTVDGIHAIYNKAPKINILNNETLTAYAGDIIDYTKDIEVKDDRDNPTGNHVIDNSKIKVTILPQENNSGGSNNEGNGSLSNSENMGEQEQTPDAGDETLINDESSSGSDDSSEDNNQNENNGSNKKDDSTKTEEEKFLEEQNQHLKIGNNKVRLTVADSWGRESTITRNLVITNGIPKNTIKFMAGKQSALEIGFDPNTNRLILTENDVKFGEGNRIENYVGITIKKKTGNNPYIAVNFSGEEKPLGNQKLSVLKSYNFEYGDTIVLNHQHPFKLDIDGTVINAREDYTDGVQNVENIINTEFEITKSGLKAVYTDPDSNLGDKNIIFGPMAPEKFPFKIKVNIESHNFNILDKNSNAILYSAGNNKVYKVVHINKDLTRTLRTLDLTGYATGMYSSIAEWNNMNFEYGDYLYIEHKEPSRSIIKGNIENAREDYSNGVDEIDNMKHVIFKLTQDGVEAVYNEAPQIKGVEDIDVYQNEPFNPADNVTYSDDHDRSDQLQTTIAIKENGTNRTLTNNGSSVQFDTTQLGEKILVYTATDRWGKTKTVERKVTVRPNLYKNVFKVYPQISSEQPSAKSGESDDSNSSIESTNPGITNIPNSSTGTTENQDSSGSSSESNSSTQNKPWQYEENKKRTPAFEIGFDTITKKYKVYNQTNQRLSNDKLEEVAFTIEIKNRDGSENNSNEGSTSSVDGINVEDEAVPQANIDAQSQESSSSQVYYLVAGLLAFLIVIVIILKRKKHRKEV